MPTALCTRSTSCERPPDRDHDRADTGHQRRGSTSESAKIKICGSSGPRLPLPPFPAWTSTFLATHIAELDTDGANGGGYVAIDWEVFGDEYYAKKEWIKESDNIVETGTFKVYHTPGA